jgi:hypothetical protein
VERRLDSRLRSDCQGANRGLDLSQNFFDSNN